MMNRREFLVVVGVMLTLILAVTASQVQSKAPATDVKEAQPLPFVQGSWTLAILPDTQHYSKSNPGLFHLQTHWIAENKAKHNIAYVLHLGDITNDNIAYQWEHANLALGRLDNVVPYALAIGNHDYVGNAKGARDTLMNEYFPPSRFAKWPTFGGVMEKGRIENSYHLFKAGGQKWLVLALEWGPRDGTLEWAGKILRKYPDHKAIIITHAYLYHDSTRYDYPQKGDTQDATPQGYKTAGGVNDGEQMWQKLVSKHANVFMVINGHVLGDGQGFLVSRGEHGNKVYQMLVNYQMYPIGGEGWLRLLEFQPDGSTIQAKTYSPLFEKYKTDPNNQFVINTSCD